MVYFFDGEDEEVVEGDAVDADGDDDADDEEGSDDDAE